MPSILHEKLWSHLGTNSGLFMGRCPNPVPQPNKKGHPERKVAFRLLRRRLSSFGSISQMPNPVVGESDAFRLALQ
jgi:hypothetical protein